MTDRETEERKAKRGDTAPVAGWISTGEMMSSTGGSTGAAAAGGDATATASGRTSGTDPGGPVAPMTADDLGTPEPERDARPRHRSCRPFRRCGVGRLRHHGACRHRRFRRRDA